MASAASNKIKYMLANGLVDFANDNFRIILMASGFIFDKDTHELYANVVGSELATDHGYVQFAKVLSAAPTITEDDLNDRTTIEWNAVSWIAAGGPIGPTCGAIILDNTVAGDPVVGFLDFLADYTQADGGTMTISDIEVRFT